MSDFLGHPLTLLVIGAALSGVLIPLFTRQWQERQKELELKTDLVGVLSETVMEMVMAVQFVHVGAGQRSAEEARAENARMNEAYRAFEVRSAVIGTRLHAWFAETTIPSDWTEYSELVMLFYARMGIPPPRREETDREIVRRLDALLRDLGTELVQRGDRWADLRAGILEANARLIQEVLRTPITAISSSPFRPTSLLRRATTYLSLR